MKRPALLLIFMLLVVTLGFAGSSLAAQELKIVGTWESETQSKGGIGTQLEFHSDGTISATIGAMVDFTYRVDQARLVMSFTDPDTKEVEENTVDFRITGDSMIQSDPESGEETRYTRVTGATQDTLPIVGSWSFEHYTGGTAFEIFTADGELHLRVPFTVDRGTYTVSEETVTIVMEGRGAWPLRYEMRGATPTLSSTDESQPQYRRVSW